MVSLPQDAPAAADLRRIPLHPGYWYPIARSHAVRPGKTLATTFAGDPIVLYRTPAGTVHALADRCAHRQFPLSLGMVEGENLRCGYHGASYRPDGQLSGDAAGITSGRGIAPAPAVRAYPCQEARGLVFVFPGEAANAAATSLPRLPPSASHRTMTFDRPIACHYSFLHENLLDMSHQHLHRRTLGPVAPEFAGFEAGRGFVEASYRFRRSSDFGARLAARVAAGEEALVAIRTAYPYQTLTLTPRGAGEPSFSLWAAYVPVDRDQRQSRAFGLLAIREPRPAWLLTLAWPLIRRMTDRVFREDRLAVEAEQAAWFQQGGDHNHETFPPLVALRDLLRQHGPGSTIWNSAPALNTPVRSPLDNGPNP